MQKLVYLFFNFLLVALVSPLAAQEAGRLSVSLEELFKMADENNRALKISSYSEELAAEEIQQQKNEMLPSLEASLSFSYNGDGWIAERDFDNGMKAPIPDFGNNFALEASQVIYAGGALKTSVDMAKLGLVLAQLDKEKNRQDIRFLISGYYLELQKLQNQKQILQHNIQQTEKLLTQIRNKFEEGVRLKNAVTRYELQKLSLELSLVKVGNAAKIINNELVNSLQLPAGTQLEVNPSADPSFVAASLSPQWQSLAQENAPILKQMQAQLEQAQHQETLARSGSLPQVFAFAANHMDGPVVIEVPPLDRNFNYWYVGVGLKYDIASIFKSKSDIRASRIATESAEERKAMVEEQLNTDIESALIRTQEARKVYETQLKGVQLATENYNITRNRYLNELVLMTELLDAENEKIDAELQAANAQINILFQQYQLKKLTGTL